MLLPTKIDIPSKTRESLIVILNGCLSDSVDLALQAKGNHWNVKGPSFTSLHKLFDEVAESAQNYADLIAERIVQLGGVALGSSQIVAATTSLPPQTITTFQSEILNCLSTSLSIYSANMRRTIEFSTYMKDDVTADILIEITRGSDKWLWMVESHMVI